VAAILFIGLLLGGETGFWLALSALIAVTIIFAASGTHRHIYREWSTTFRCSRCGTTFAVLEQEPSASCHQGTEVTQRDRGAENEIRRSPLS